MNVDPLSRQITNIQYLLHPMLRGGDIHRRRGLSAGQGDVVLAGQIHLPDHLRFQLPIAQAAVAETFPLPLLGGVAILTDPKPVRRSPKATNGSISDLLHLFFFFNRGGGKQTVGATALSGTENCAKRREQVLTCPSPNAQGKTQNSHTPISCLKHKKEVIKLK